MPRRLVRFAFAHNGEVADKFEVDARWKEQMKTTETSGGYYPRRACCQAMLARSDDELIAMQLLSVVLSVV